jgi:3-hydroxymyristoyl/3-hydroxydecanoyl-(acyl carrier protein) dehydratase
MIKELIPQREPFVMVDKLLACNTSAAKTSLSIRCGNIFVENGMFSQCGIIENVAQTCAAMMGYNSKNQKVRIGMIGSIGDFEFLDGCAMVGDEIFTEIMVEAQMGSIILLNANVLCNQKILAHGKMKVVLTNIEV